MALPRSSEDVPQEQKAPPCAVCGRPSGCEAWGFPLCYGDTTGRVGCVSRLSQVMPEENCKAFTHRWVAEQKKARAA